MLLTDQRISEIREREEKATKGPLTYEKRESMLQGSWHYAIKTEYNPPEHPWSPRFVAWMCGSLGESVPNRRNPDDYRNDPEIEADCEFFSKARTDIPDLLADRKELLDTIDALKQQLATAKEEHKSYIHNSSHAAQLDSDRIRELERQLQEAQRTPADIRENMEPNK